MTEYSVQCGSMKITVFADDAYDAAMESVAQWSSRGADAQTSGHRRRLAEGVRVEARDGGGPNGERFATFDLLARLQGQTPDKAWSKLLGYFDPDRN